MSLPSICYFSQKALPALCDMLRTSILQLHANMHTAGVSMATTVCNIGSRGSAGGLHIPQPRPLVRQGGGPCLGHNAAAQACHAQASHEVQKLISCSSPLHVNRKATWPKLLSRIFPHITVGTRNIRWYHCRSLHAMLEILTSCCAKGLSLQAVVTRPCLLTGLRAMGRLRRLMPPCWHQGICTWPQLLLSSLEHVSAVTGPDKWLLRGPNAPHLNSVQ